MSDLYDLEAAEAFLALEEQRRHPRSYPLTKLEQIQEDYADEIRQERWEKRQRRLGRDEEI